MKKETIEKVIKWADDRGITSPENSHKQMLKLVEEVGELTSAILKNKEHEIVDAIGDIQVVLVILCKQLGVNVEEAFDLAYEVIKDRSGKTINGVFVKNENV